MANPSAAAVYLVLAPVCLVLPFVVPADSGARPLPVVLAAGVPLCILSILLSISHQQQRLDGSGYRAVAWSFLLGAGFMLSPLGYWIDSIAVHQALSVVHKIVPILAASTMSWLTVRMWHLRSRMKVVFAVGVGLVALRFAWSAYQLIVEQPGTLEEVSAGLASFMIDCVIASLILLIGIVGHWLQKSRAATV